MKGLFASSKRIQEKEFLTGAEARYWRKYHRKVMFGITLDGLDRPTVVRGIHKDFETYNSLAIWH